MGNDQAQMMSATIPVSQPQMSPAEQARLRAAQYLAAMGPAQPGMQPVQPQSQPLPPLPPPPMVMVPVPTMPPQAQQAIPTPQQAAMAQMAQAMQQYAPPAQPVVGPPAPVFQPMPVPTLPAQGGQQIAQSLRSPATYDPNQEPLTTGDAYSGDYSLPAAYYKFGRYVDGNGEDIDPAATGYRFYNRAGTASYARPFLPTVKGKYAQNNTTQNLATNNPK